MCFNYEYIDKAILPTGSIKAKASFLHNDIEADDIDCALLIDGVFYDYRSSVQYLTPNTSLSIYFSISKSYAIEKCSELFDDYDAVNVALYINEEELVSQTVSVKQILIELQKKGIQKKNSF